MPDTGVPEVTPGFWIIRIAATTTVDTTLADFADRSLGNGQPAQRIERQITEL
jgi:uncharacterized membrane-anchored protein